MEDRKRGRVVEAKIFGGERGRHLAFTKRLGAVLASVCAAAVAIWVLDPDLMVYYVKPGVAAGGERACVVYQRRSPLRRRTSSFFVFAEGDRWSRRNRFFGEYTAAVQRGDELLLFFDGATYGSYRGEKWEKARNWPPGWTAMGGERVGGKLWVVGADRNLRAAVWEEGEWKESGKGPAVVGRVKDLALVGSMNDELWVLWSDEDGKWLARVGPSWGERRRLTLPDAIRLGATLGTTEESFWVFYAVKEKKALQWAEVNEGGEVVGGGEVDARLSTRGRISGIAALRRGKKAWVFATGFGGVKRLYFDGEGWEDGGWVERAGLLRKVGRSLWAVVFTLMPVLTVMMAAAVFRMQEAFSNALMGVRESYVGSWWKRGTAQLLDGLLYAPMCAGVWGLLGGWKLWQVSVSGLGLLAAYFVISEGIWGSTLGKAALGLTVVREDGGRAGIAAAAVRNAARAIDFLPVGYAAGIVAARKGKLRQRIGDRAARTVVVNKAGLERRLDRVA